MKLSRAIARGATIGALLAGASAAIAAEPAATTDARSPAAIKAPPSIPALLDADQKAGYARVFAAIRDSRWTDAQLQLDALKPGPLHAIARAELYTAKGSPKVDVERWSRFSTKPPNCPRPSSWPASPVRAARATCPRSRKRIP